ncbi:family 43 glycosylhydrolase [Treponema sp.]|uniref:family 43 glycosylhydrolase n=1 Tax=Treponema sp. TaxID=166 RepID=UPI0025DB65F7|nr:family 43 glycosylhydrolase [Treponema sp.]MCR5219337.1 family 43 glycosylhydrolase [Treponema sp.]
MKKLLSIITAAASVILSASFLASCSEDVENYKVYTGPLVQRRSEPGVYLHSDGNYYCALAYEYGTWASIELRRTDCINNFRITDDQAAVISASTTSEGDANYAYFFGPEIRFIDGSWYMFYSASTSSTSSWTQRPFVARCDEEDPVSTSAWTVLGKVEAVTDSEFNTYDDIIDSYSLGTTVFEYDDQWYMMWSQRIANGSDWDLDDDDTTLTLEIDGENKTYEDLAHSTLTSYNETNPNTDTNIYWDCIFIGKTSPDDFTQVTDAKIISVPEYDWECGIYSEHSDTSFGNTNNAPQALIHGNDLFVVFSASDMDESYCMGIMKCNNTSDLTSMANWTKSSSPVFESDTSYQTYGPGHCSFTTDDGYDVMFYSARLQYGLSLTSTGSTGTDSYSDKNRALYAKSFTWKSNGYPDFGRAGGRD